METRLSLRIQANMKIICKISEESSQEIMLVSGNSFEVNAFNISETGIGIIAKYLLPKGLLVELWIDGTIFGLKESMKIKGEISYCKYSRHLNKYRCGIKFLDMDDLYKKIIAKFILAVKEKRLPAC